MNALSAPIQHVEPGETLLLVVALPLVAAIANGVGGARLARTWGAGFPRTVALAGTGGALALLIHAVTLLVAVPPENRVLFEAPWSLARMGALHASVGLSLDPLSALLAIVVALFALGAHLSSGASSEETSHGMHARVSLLVGGALLALVADSVPAFVAGVAAASVATTSLANDASPVKSFASAQLGSLLVLAGAIVLFWALGGSWGIALGMEPTYTRRNPIPAGTTSELDVDDDAAVGPSIYPVIVGNRPTETKADPMAKGTLSIPAWPGSRVYLRGATTPSGVTPLLRQEVNSGRFDVELERGGKRTILRAIEIPAHGETVIVPVGPTLSLRELRDQITLVDASKQAFVRVFLDPYRPGHRRVFGVSAASLAGSLFALGALAIALSGRTAARTLSPLTSAALPLVAVAFVARASFLLALSPAASTTLAGLSALAAVLAAALACVATDTRRALSLLLASQLGLAGIGLGAQATAAATVLALVAILAAAAAQAALEVLEERALRIAIVALVGAPIPLGVGFARDLVLGRTFSSDLVMFPKIVWGVALAAVFLASFAAFRLVSARVITVVDDRLGRVATLVALAAALLGPILAWSGDVFVAGMGDKRTYVESLLAPAFDVAAILGERAPHAAEPAKSVGFAISALVLLAAVAGWARGRRVTFEQPARLSLPIAPAFGRVAAALHSVVAAMVWIDERVLSFPARALAALVVRGRDGDGA